MSGKKLPSKPKLPTYMVARFRT